MAVCSTCGQNVAFSAPSNPSQRQAVIECGYTKETIQSWKDTILCSKEENKYELAGLTVKDINKYLGILNSVVLYNNNPCLFIDSYTEIYQAVLVIKNLNICP